MRCIVSLPRQPVYLMLVQCSFLLQLLCETAEAAQQRREFSVPEENLRGRSKDEYLTVATLLQMINERNSDRRSSPVDFQIWLDKWDGLFERDLVLSAREAKRILTAAASKRRRRKRKLRADVQLWDARQPIRFFIDTSYITSQKNAIREALRHWEQHTCLRFEETPTILTGPAEYLYFQRASSCSSPVGKVNIGTATTIAMAPACLRQGVIAHEVGHAMGFWHEHTRPDRDAYIRINANNIKADTQFNFQKRSPNEVRDYDVPYDLSSVMHYGSQFFSVNNDPDRPTIETVDPLKHQVIGAQIGLSFYDAKLANIHYCSNVCLLQSTLQPCQSGGYQDPNRCSACRCPDGFGGDFCQTVQSSPTGCSRELTLQCGSSGTVQNPAYPSQDSSAKSCSWMLSAPQGSNIRVRVTDMDIAWGQHFNAFCSEFLEIKYEADKADVGIRLCGPMSVVRDHYQSLQTGLLSEDNDVLVMMRTGNGVASYFAKFRLTYQVECTSLIPSTSPPFIQPSTPAPIFTTDLPWWLRTTQPPATTTTPAPLPSYWSQWSSWSQCTKSCGGCGISGRTRFCVYGAFGTCTGSPVEVVRCGPQVCPQVESYTCYNPVYSSFTYESLCNNVLGGQYVCIQTGYRVEYYTTRTCYRNCCEGFLLYAGTQCLAWNEYPRYSSPNKSNGDQDVDVVGPGSSTNKTKNGTLLVVENSDDSWLDIPWT